MNKYTHKGMKQNKSKGGYKIAGGMKGAKSVKYVGAMKKGKK